MTNYPTENEEKAARLIELVKKSRAAMPPRPHDVRTPEHFAQCDECRQWQRAREASFEEIEKQEGMMSGEQWPPLLRWLYEPETLFESSPVMVWSN